tara:strand:- start:353 stop:1234 length:882 start_codon:yes stop_codon:yes gene_type:complete
MEYSFEKSNLKKTNKVFVFGASGFIGKVLLRKIYNNSETIGVGRNNEEVFFDLNYSDPESLKRYISKDDIWIFLAAISSPDECESNPDLAFKINVTKTKHLISWLTSQGVKVIFTSSDAVYSGIEGCVDDDETPHPIGSYASHKALVENYVRENNLVKVARFSYILGYEDKFSSMLRASEKSNKKLDIFLGFERCVVLLDDVVMGIQSLIDNWDRFDFKYINFCGPFLIDRVEMAKILKEKLFPRLDYYPKEAPKNFWISRAKRIHLDYKNFSKVLGRSPKSINEFRGMDKYD